MAFRVVDALTIWGGSGMTSLWWLGEAMLVGCGGNRLTRLWWQRLVPKGKGDHGGSQRRDSS